MIRCQACCTCATLQWQEEQGYKPFTRPPGDDDAQGTCERACERYACDRECPSWLYFCKWLFAGPIAVQVAIAGDGGAGGGSTPFVRTQSTLSAVPAALSRGLKHSNTMERSSINFQARDVIEIQ